MKKHFTLPSTIDQIDFLMTTSLPKSIMTTTTSNSVTRLTLFSLFMALTTVAAIAQPGSLVVNVPSSGVYNFPVGTASAGYTPASLDFNSVSIGGDVSVAVADGSPAAYASANLNQTKKLNRNWTVTNVNTLSGFSANGTFDYNSSTDLAGGATSSELKAAKLDGTTWSYPTTTTAASKFTAQGINSFSTFTAGAAPMAVGAALDFDGVNDRVEVPDAGWNDFGAGNFTVEFWVKKQATSSGWSNVTGVGKWNTGGAPGSNEWLVSLCNTTGNGNNPNFTIEIGSTSYNCVSPDPLTIGTWTHLAGVREGTNIKIYVNGVLKNTVACGAAAINNIAAREIMLGKLDGFGGHTNMEMDELRIWNVARTQAEIAASMNCEMPSSTSNLVANYQFNQGTADANNTGVTTLQDNSGNSRNGTLINFGLTAVSVSNWTTPGGVVTGTSCLGPVRVYTDNTLTTLVSNHTTIQGAINAGTTLSGYVITVQPGTYDEMVNISKANLTIKGVGTPKPTITWTGATPGDAVKGLVTVNASGATIENFTMNVDLAKLNSAIAANGTNANNLTIKSNSINPTLSSSYVGSYGRRNAININYRDSRVSNSNPSGILVQRQCSYL